MESVNPHKQIGIDSYGASITTMDEIFLKVTHQDEVEQESENSLRFGLRNSRGRRRFLQNIDSKTSKSEAEETEILLDLSKSVKLIDDKKALFKQQFRGAFMKSGFHGRILSLASQTGIL